MNQIVFDSSIFYFYANKQELSAIKKLIDFMVNQGIMPFNKAATVRGPKYSLKEGKTQELTAAEVRRLFEAIESKEELSIKDHRDLAILGLFFYQWQRVGSLLISIRDYRYNAEPRTLRFK